MRDILVEDQNQIRTIWLNRAVVKNALNTNMRFELRAAIENINKHTKAIFIRGKAGDFCAGQDLGSFTNLDVTQAVDGEKILREEYEPILTAIEDCHAPVIAIVEGACVGAGFSLAMACDFILAHERAYFQLAFAKIGLVPDVGASYFLPRRVGAANAMAMALTAKRMDAQEAKLMGVVWEVWGDEIFETRLLEYAEYFTNSAPRAMEMTRKLLRASFENTKDAQLAMEAECQNQALNSPDFREGVAAFLAKRIPQFTRG